MAPDLVSLAAASKLLGVSSERVRQLVVAGDLPGIRFGNSWAVLRDAVEARQQLPGRRGRPLGARRAWEAIGAGDVDLSNMARYRNRGEVHRYSMSTGDARYLMTELGAIESGVAGAVFYGELLQAAGAEVSLYVPLCTQAALPTVVAAISDPVGSVVLRVVSDDLWPYVESLASSSPDGRLVAPRGAVALDLMVSGDARHWVAAESLVFAHA